MAFSRAKALSLILAPARVDMPCRSANLNTPIAKEFEYLTYAHTSMCVASIFGNF